MRRGRLYRQHTATGRRITAWEARHRRGRRFYMPDPHRWRRELDFRGLRPLDVGAAAERRLYDWAKARGRADGRPTRLWVACALLAMHRPNPDEQTIAVGHQQLADVIAGRLYGPQLSRQTVQRIVQEMCDDGVLFLVSRGCSAQVTGDRNHVSVYVVVDVEALDPADQAEVADLRKRLVGHHPVGEVDIDSGSAGRSSPRTTGTISPERAGPQRREQPERYTPRTAQEREQAAFWLLADLGWRLGRRDRRRLCSLLRDWFDAGWSARALRAAVERTPDGVPFPGPLPGHRQRDRHGAVLVRDLVGVLGWRLGAWRVGGEPGRPPIEADQPRRGHPRSAALPTEPVPATPAPADILAEIRAGIAAGRAAAAARDEAWRASRRLAR